MISPFLALISWFLFCASKPQPNIMVQAGTPIYRHNGNIYNLIWQSRTKSPGAAPELQMQQPLLKVIKEQLEFSDDPPFPELHEKPAD